MKIRIKLAITRYLAITYSFIFILFGIIGINSNGYCEFLNSSKITSSSPQTIEQAQSQAYGTRPTIAVMEFDNKTGSYGHMGPIGSGFKEQLVTALTQTNAFIVLERQAIKDVLGEQDFGASGRVRQGTASEIGEIEGANFLIYGAITEYQANQAHVGGGVGVYSLPGLMGSMFKQNHVAIDIRIVDSRTSRILNATSVEGKAGDIGASFGGQFGGLLAGIGGGYKTPIQKAIRSCMIKAVNWIAVNLLTKNVRSTVKSKTVQNAAHTNKPTTVQNVNQPQQSTEDHLERRLTSLKKLRDKGLITKEEYKERKKEILEGL